LPTKAETKSWLEKWGPWLLVWLPLGFWFVRPLWVAPVLPLDDLPNHLARITALHYLDDPRWNLAAFYERSLGPVPYLGHFYLVHLLTYVFRSVPRANLVYMSAYVLAAPLCGLAYARATGRSRWLALFLLPMSTAIFFQWGFIAFCVGVMLSLPACALLYKTLDEPTWRRAIGLGLLTCALYLHHILPWGAFGAYAFLLILVEVGAKRWRGALVASAAMLPSLGLFRLGLGRARESGYLHAHQVYDAVKDSPAKVIGRATGLLNLWQQQSVDEWVQIGLMLMLVVLLLSDAGADASEPARKRARVPLAMIAFILMALVTPFWIKKPFNWWMVNVRFFMMAAAVGCFLPRGPIAGARAALLGLGLAASTLLPYYMAKQFKEFSTKAEPIVKLIGETPLGSNTLLLHTPSLNGQHRPFDDKELAPEMALWREVYNYPLIYRGGYDPYLYDDGFPVRRIPKNALRAPKVESAAVQIWSADDTRFKPDQMLRGWDFFLVKDDNVDAMPPDGVVLVDTQGVWNLYRNLLKDQPQAEPPQPAIVAPEP
jgi:hypothetical protein